MEISYTPGRFDDSFSDSAVGRDHVERLVARLREK
jgi:hypothetical protein